MSVESEESLQLSWLTMSRKRNAIVTNIKKELDKGLHLMEEEDLSARELNASMFKLFDYRVRYRELSEKMGPLYADQSKLEIDLDRQEEIEELITDLTCSIQAALTSLSESRRIAAAVVQPAPVTAATPPPPVQDWKAKLPVLDVEKFSGDPMGWAAFKDTFVAVVDSKPMPFAEKFRYLKSYLAGDALRMLEGYMANEASYHSAWQALCERYGNPDLVTYTHLVSMIEMPKLKGYNVDQLTKMRDDCEYHIRSLVAYGMDESTFEKVFTPLILSKLPPGIRFDLNREMVDKPWSLDQLRDLLRKQIRARDMSRRQGDMHTEQKVYEQRPKPKGKFQPETGGASSSAMLPANNQKGKGKQQVLQPKSNPKFVRNCRFCGSDDHFPDQCTQYPDIPSRLKKLGTGCRRCLSASHKISECQSIKVCRFCDSKSHNRSLCEGKFGSASGQGKGKGTVNVAAAGREAVESEEVDPFSVNGNDPFSVTQMASSGSRHVHMQTAIACIRNTQGSKQVKARLLFDTAASRSFVTTRKAQQVEAKPFGEDSMSIAGFEQKSRRSKTYRVVQLDVVCRDRSVVRVEARVADTLTCAISKPALDLSKYPTIRSLPLAEPCIDGTELLSVDLLIGADSYYDFVGGEIIREPDGTVFVSSKLGFLTSGSSDEVDQGDSIVQVVLAAPEVGVDSNFDLEKFWRLEQLGIKSEEIKRTSGDEEALFNFQQSVEFKNGRYTVSLPWKQLHPELQSHYFLCKGRLKSLVSRLKRSRDVLLDYDRTIRDQLAKEIIEKAPLQSDGSAHYIPHHEVLTPQKTTTKLRIVYDCSAKLRGGDVSLNDCLFRGPIILEDLAGLLMRFRVHNIAIVSDIEKAFLQIEVQEKDRDVLRILWLEDIGGEVTKGNIVEYRFARVLFGASPSPSLLGMVVDHHLRSVGTTNAIQAAEDMFVDNNVTGFEEVDSGERYYRELKGIFQQASMNLREWYTNEPLLRRHFAIEDQGKGESTKVLGVEWNLGADDLKCSGKFGKVVGTKRQILSSVATLFDPCGWFGPVVLPGKLLIRDLWRLKYDWDVQLPPEILEQWQKLEESLSLIDQHRVQRRASRAFSVQDSDRQLHCFVDASAQAYEAAVYLRCEKDGRVETCLMFSKSRVTPVKPELTIPKLELMAATLGVDLLEFVRKELRVVISAIFLWSDSQCVLHWINSVSKPTVFVANRVKKIRACPDVIMRYVPTEVNPADIASRGTDCKTLLGSPIWWQGPAFLSMDEGNWPQWELPVTLEAALKPENSFVVEQSLPAVFAVEPWIEVTRFKTLSALLRTVAYVLRFGHNLRNRQNRRVGRPSASEIADARFQLDKLAQVQLPSLDAAEKNRRKQLAVYTDDRGLLRCHTRLGKTELASETISPILLPDTGHYTTLVVWDSHLTVGHGQISQTLAKLRESYWVTRGRDRIKAVISECRVCRFISGGGYRLPPAPDIPRFRVTRSLPFECIGLDYVGPLLIKSAHGESKVWICLFTCAVIRAVHLEVVEDMTTNQFLLAFRRFVARFRLPKIVVSDNAKQFVAGVETMAKIWQDILTSSEVQDFAAIRGLRWKFVTEKAPWFGGFYERLVGAVKNGLKRALHQRKVSLVELQTVVCEVSAVVNDRPLVYLEQEPGQFVLTPSHFISRGPLGNKPTETLDADEDDDDFLLQPRTADKLIKEYCRIRKLLDAFWQVWHREYLVSLRHRKDQKRQRNVVDAVPQIGDKVLIIDEGMPRGSWKIGHISELHLSQDGHCRSVTVTTFDNKQLKRPVKLLVPLEFGENLEESPVFGGTDQHSQFFGKNLKNSKEAAVRPTRSAARSARSKIRDCLLAEDDSE